MTALLATISATTTLPDATPVDAAPPRRAAADRFLIALAIILAGYALGGRGFAYIGVPPVFIGEAVLLAGLCVLLATRHVTRMLAVPQMLFLLCWVGWCMLRTLPDIPRYGIEALRDGVVWGYSAFALIVAAVILERPERLVKMVRRYGRFAILFVACIPVIYVIYRGFGVELPRLPGRAPLVQVKEADALVHMSGILTFWAVGLAGKRIAWKWYFLMAANLAMMGVIDRAGLVAFGAAMFISMLFAPRSAAPWRMIMFGVVGAMALWVTDFRYEVSGGKGREVSFQQFVTNISSIVGDTNNDGLDSTKEWRVNWWRDIRDYTINGPYFWTGKGFGVNLADDDGYQVLADGSLRSPHNVHMVVLARSGVPGVVLWGLAQLAFACGIAVAFFRSRSAGHDRWARLFLFLGTYWLVLLINGSFDVFIEGPMGGIWFWTVFGVGIAALGLYRQRPELLDELVVNDDIARTEGAPRRHGDTESGLAM